MRHTTVHTPGRLLFIATLVLLSTLAFVSAPAAAGDKVVTVAPASRVENIESPPPFGLPDQTFHNVTFMTPLTTSLITVANRGETGHRAFFVSVHVEGGGFFAFIVREGADVILPLAQPIPVTSVSIRCDSFSAARCKYTVSLVGN